MIISVKHYVPFIRGSSLCVMGGIVYGIMLIGPQKSPAVKWEGEIYVVRYFFFASSAFTSTLLLVEERLLNSSMTLLNFFGSGLPEVYSRT